MSFWEMVEHYNTIANDFIWGVFGVALLLITGLLMTIFTKCFQVTHFRHWIRNTVLSIKNKPGEKKAKKEGEISQFQALCTALAATIGTGNIAGVATAIMSGGAGAIFWMWFAAFFGMATKFSEISLGIYFRRRNKDGAWSGGAMYYLSDGLGQKKGMKVFSRVLAGAFALFAMIASLGTGNLSQVNSIVKNLESAFLEKVPQYEILGLPAIPLFIGLVLFLASAVVIFGGLKRLAAVSEKIVPLMALLYVGGSVLIIAVNFSRIGAMFACIFRSAFNIHAVEGGVVGLLTKVVVSGCRRGIFSNEAGLGSAVMVHSSARVKDPARQGMWGIFEVFSVTFIICTMTALTILSSGYVNLTTGFVETTGLEGATLTALSFGSVFGSFGQIFVAVSLCLFAFTTILGWSEYGAKATEYLFGNTAGKVYKVIFVFMIIPAAVMTSDLAWGIADTFNGLMMIPNLIGLVALAPLVAKITKNYVDRIIHGKKDIQPMYSYDPALQKEMEETEL